MSKMVLGIFVVKHESAEPTDDPEDMEGAGSIE